MRRDRGRPSRRGSSLLTGLFLLTAGVLPPGTAAQEKVRSPEFLVEQAARAASPARRAALAREALKVLARRGGEAPLLEARAWLLLGDPLQAVRALERSPLPQGRPLPREVRPLFREVLEALLERGMPSQALPLLTRIFGRVRPRPAWVPALLVRAWTGAGKGERTLSPRDVVAAGKEALEAGWRGRPFLQAYYQALVELDREGCLQEALQGFQALARAFPRAVWAALSLAVSLRHLERYREAAEVLHRAAEFHPEDPALPTDEGLTWKCLGRMEKAEACFRRGIAAAPPGKTRDPRISLGLLLLDRGDRKEAEAVLRPTLDLKPPQPYAWLLWVRSAFCCGKRGF